MTFNFIALSQITEVNDPVVEIYASILDSRQAYRLAMGFG